MELIVGSLSLGVDFVHPGRQDGPYDHMAYIFQHNGDTIEEDFAFCPFVRESWEYPDMIMRQLMIKHYWTPLIQENLPFLQWRYADPIRN